MSEATQQELGEMLHPSGSQAGDALSNTHSEPGRSWIRPLVFVALAMAMTTQALMTSWISASVPRKSNHCELKVFNDMELSSALFDTVCAWLNIGVNFVPTVLAGYYLIKNTTRLGSRLSFDWYSAFMLSIVGTLCCSMAYQWKRVQKDFSNQELRYCSGVSSTFVSLESREHSLVTSTQRQPRTITQASLVKSGLSQFAAWAHCSFSCAWSSSCATHC